MDAHEDDLDATERDGESAPRRYARRLPDRLLTAFHIACDQGEHEIATQLLQIVEPLITRDPATPDPNRRRNLQNLLAAHTRLWHLRHPGAAR